LKLFKYLLILKNQEAKTQNHEKNIYKDNELLAKVLEIQKMNDKILFQKKQHKKFEFKDQMTISYSFYKVSDSKVHIDDANINDDI
jgi:hypothetical protein